MSEGLSTQQKDILRALKNFGPSGEILSRVESQIRNTRVAGIKTTPQECVVLYSRTLLYALNIYRLHGKPPLRGSQEDIMRIAQSLTRNHFARI